MTKYDIYLIWGKDCDGNILRYYGSTSNFIKRKNEHGSRYKKWVKAGRPSKYKCSSVYILDNGDWRMEKIEEVIGERWEAKKKEGEYIKNNECVNVSIPLRTPKEYYNDNKDILNKKYKEYRNQNKDKIAEYQKQYNINNKDKILEWKINNKDKCKEWRKQNKDKLDEQKKKWFEKNKQAVLEKQKEKIICECGAEIAKNYIYKHRKNKKHINLISNNEKNVETLDNFCI